jgi:signal transduction histidine kinase
MWSSGAEGSIGVPIARHDLMTSDNDALQPEREQTDESLQNERTKTDAELGAGLRGIETDAAEVVADMRHGADHALATARAKADERAGLASPKSQAVADVAMHAARAIEDAGVVRDRAATDQKLRANAEYIGALLRLLPAEREKTDLHLLSEREHADAAIAHRDDFLSIVSHDLRSLLGTVSLSAQIIESDASAVQGAELTLLNAQRIQRATHHMTRLIGDLVDVSAIEAGRLAISVSAVDANVLVTDVVHTFQEASERKGLTLERGRIADELAGTFDRDRALQVLANLLGNAIKFVPTGGTVRVDAERAGAEVRFSVSDNGPGIQEGKLAAVFERFWQVGENDRRGLGLGLYIAKSIVEAQGGRIWVTSTLGKGSTFYFTLPAIPAAEQALRDH